MTFRNVVRLALIQSQHPGYSSLGAMATKRVVQGYSRDAGLADLFSVKREFNKLFFVIRDLKVLRDP